ncbi:NADH-quinone oxidoreductase subunit NuoE [Rhodopseudomonas palustris]|uniref:NADH-quinone oxidoreductase subunit NuoE n=1 Tax=Rhodopseudomonas palustris TaxID=1076 RepID=UPI0021F36C87|nr:NADH-quinone oxidoreductase subunit NuoE [Rhodopseudomonas palustris]UYO52020.1 NADH-quinone oxidoreductase subunit NuoE [Rhodopseudomonas palustris]
MSVRRLAPKELQPESFAFTAENLAWAQKEITKYPPGRQFSAVIAIMWRAQEQCGGWLPEAAIRNVADMLQMPHIRALEVATFYTMFQLNPVGKKAHVQVCGTTPCRLRGAGELIEVCKNRIHHDPFHLSADGDFSWEEVECAGACVNAPMVQIWKDTYEDLTPETLNKVLDGFASGNPPAPGPQNGRQHAAPITGPTTLKTGGINVSPVDANGPPLTDDEAKRAGAAANVQERPAPKPPAADATEKNPP